MADDFKSILNKAKDETNKELVNEIKGLTLLSEDDINKIASTDIDKTKLRDLLIILNDSKESNEKKNSIIKELIDTSDVILNIINKIL